MTPLIVLALVIVVTLAVGGLLRARSGVLRPAGTPVRSHDVDPDLRAAGVGAGRTVVLHFSAPWCGPCAAVRRVIEQTLADRPELGHEVELDFDEFGSLARRLGVLSLPTTFVFDRDGRERFRASGVPSQTDLRAALGSL